MERREKDSRRLPVFTRVRKKVVDDKQLTYNTWRSTKMMGGVPMSTLGLVVAGFMIGLGDSAPQAKALQGLIVAGFMIDLGDSVPQAKAPQAQILRKVDASAAKE